MPEILSRISCEATRGSFEKSNSTMMLPKLSSELERMPVHAADARDRLLDLVDHFALDDVGRGARDR